MASGPDTHEYLVRDSDRGGPTAVKDTKTLGSAYDRYLQSMQASSYAAGEGSKLSGATLGSKIPMGEPSIMGHPGPLPSEIVSNGRIVGFGGQLPVDSMARPVRETVPLPPDVSNTLYVEGLPPDCTKREAARILFQL